MKPTLSRPVAHVLGVDVDAINMESALARVFALLQGSQKGYVCVAGVHGIMEAKQNPELYAVYSGACMTIPDGMPLVWVGHIQGHSSMQRVTGPDLMIEIFRRKQFAGFTHFLYGGREGIAEKLRDNLRERFPWTEIVGTFTPPYRELAASEQEALVETVRDLKPDIIWVGISCPKQERFMAHYLPRIETKLMFGVGAAFDYHTGGIRDCSEWIKKAGMQWLHRMIQDPRRLWRRYLRNNPAFLWHLAFQLLTSRKSRQHPETSRKIETTQ